MNDKNWLTEESQAEVRRMWADNPAMEREQTVRINPGVWIPCKHEDWFSEVYYRPAQKPRERSQREIDDAAYIETLKSKTGWTVEDVWHAACAYAREASRKGVA